MNTIAYLQTHTLDQLNSELGINIARHETEPLAILNYDQIESPKTNPIVRECRGLVINTETLSVVARAFPRFYNWGEVADEMPLFDWSSATVEEKADGSLVLIYFYNGSWRANTRGSFAASPMLNEHAAKYYGINPSFTWHDGFLVALGVKSLDELNLDRSLTYVCEFCSLWNKVVREYKTPCMYMITRFDGLQEIGATDHPNFRRLESYSLNTADEVLQYVASHPEATFEGVVVKDAGFRRWKLKNPRYVALHHMKGNGENMWMPKYMLPSILANEGDELLTHFPEIREVYEEYKGRVDSAYNALEALWAASKDIASQKDFALSIVGKTPFTAVLFTARKTGQELRKVWAGHGDGILKVLFK